MSGFHTIGYAVPKSTKIETEKIFGICEEMSSERKERTLGGMVFNARSGHTVALLNGANQIQGEVKQYDFTLKEGGSALLEVYKDSNNKYLYGIDVYLKDEKNEKVFCDAINKAFKGFDLSPEMFTDRDNKFVKTVRSEFLDEYCGSYFRDNFLSLAEIDKVKTVKGKEATAKKSLKPKRQKEDKTIDRSR